MSEAFRPEAMSRRRALALFGLASASCVALPPILLTVAAAQAQTVPPAFDQVDKPIPGERGTPRSEGDDEKPIPGDEGGPKKWRPRRKRDVERRTHRRKLRRKPRQVQPPATSAEKPK